MENVLLVVHVITCIALIGVVLLQRSEGGALGIGGGGGGGLMSGRGAASVLTRTTMILAAVFFLTSLILTTYATRTAGEKKSLADDVAAEENLTLPSDALPGTIDSLSDEVTVPDSANDLPVDTTPEASTADVSDLPADEPQN